MERNRNSKPWNIKPYNRLIFHYTCIVKTCNARFYCSPVYSGGDHRGERKIIFENEHTCDCQLTEQHINKEQDENHDDVAEEGEEEEEEEEDG